MHTNADSIGTQQKMNLLKKLKTEAEKVLSEKLQKKFDCYQCSFDWNKAPSSIYIIKKLDVFLSFL